MAQLNDAKRALLKEGLASYLDALAAVREFQNEIQGQCQEILKRHLPTLSQAMGCKAEPNAVEPYTYPSNPIKGNLSDGIWLGAQCRIPDFDLTFLVCLEWWKEEDTHTECTAVAAFDVYNNELFGILSQKFQEQRASDWKGIEIRESVSPDDPEACLIKADEIVDEWVNLWRSVGTLSAIMPNHSRK